MFFPEPLPEGIFGGPKCRFMLKMTILGAFAIFPESENGPLGPPFLPKGCAKVPAPKYTEPPGAVPDATCDPKRPRDQFFSILVAFWEHFGAIFDGFGIAFWMHFQ